MMYNYSMKKPCHVCPTCKRIFDVTGKIVTRDTAGLPVFHCIECTRAAEKL